MQQAFLITLAAALPMALLSSLLVLRGWALMGDAISHAVLPGIVIAYALGAPLVLGAFAAGMVCALATGYLAENSRVKQDTVMGVVFSGMFGLGIVLYRQIETDVHLDHILFGDMLGVTWGDVVQTAAIAAVIALILILRRRDFMVHAFDAQHARAIGLPVGWLHYGLLALISLSVVAALKAVGLILAVAMIVGPGAIAFLWTRRFGPMMALSAAVSLFCVFFGIYASFWIDSAPAPTIVVLMTLIFIGSFLKVSLSARAAARRDGAAPAPSARP
ncbi:iron chelate uptake ABC transporter family permease subunit [Rhodobacteraceae bacterium KN286]|uniref:Iron chelate uptake ABC transporter family permease subunit n=2 Tax=Oceanomicrobium pacificus TaxID=2692916 RepID=A0A6B0TZV1_9RHOB|nr:iron chelate uptake ABC transporter family permease subunit [Oceanomicrobium pacificus]